MPFLWGGERNRPTAAIDLSPQAAERLRRAAKSMGSRSRSGRHEDQTGATSRVTE